MSSTPAVAEITRRERFVFAAGDLYAGGGSSLIAILYLIFLTDVVGLAPGLAGTAVLVAKLWDAINDPLTGAISDRVRTRFGRRRPFIFVGSLLLIGAMALLWMPTSPAESQLGMMAWAMFSYIAYNTVQTIMGVPYASLSTEITTDPDERNKVNVLRLLFSTVSSAGCTLVASELVNAYQAGSLSAAELYGWVVLGFGAFFTVPMLGVALFTRERVPLTEPEPFNFIKNFARPLRLPSMRSLMGMYLCQAIAMDIISATILYYSRYVVNGISSTVFLGLFIAVNVVAFPIVNHLVRSHSKNRIYHLLLPIAWVAIVIIALYPSDAPPVGVYAVAGVLAVGMAGAQMLSWVMFPDVLDDAEIATGVRNSGSYTGLMTFTRGVATAITIQIIGLVLQFTGYRGSRPGDAVTDGPVQQPDSAIWGIRLVLGIGVLVLLVVGWFVARRYPLSHSRCVEMKQVLLEQRAARGAELMDVAGSGQESDESGSEPPKGTPDR